MVITSIRCLTRGFGSNHPRSCTLFQPPASSQTSAASPAALRNVVWCIASWWIVLGIDDVRLSQSSPTSAGPYSGDIKPMRVKAPTIGGTLSSPPCYISTSCSPWYVTFASTESRGHTSPCYGPIVAEGQGCSTATVCCQQHPSQKADRC